jgi:hypothetical protein
MPNRLRQAGPVGQAKNVLRDDRRLVHRYGGDSQRATIARQTRTRRKLLACPDYSQGEKPTGRYWNSQTQPTVAVAVAIRVGDAGGTPAPSSGDA